MKDGCPLPERSSRPDNLNRGKNGLNNEPFERNILVGTPSQLQGGGIEFLKFCPCLRLVRLEYCDTITTTSTG